MGLTGGVAGVIVLVLVVLNSFGIGPAQWFGPFAQAADTRLDTDYPVLETVDVRASSTRDAVGSRTFHAANVLDGDRSTSWHEAADDEGLGEWIELRLAEPGEIAKIIIWNGDQAEGAFHESPRLASVIVDVDDRRFVVDLLDVDGPQAIDLPEPVASDHVRLTIDGIFEGDLTRDTAVSRIEVRGNPLE